MTLQPDITVISPRGVAVARFENWISRISSLSRSSRMHPG